MGNNAVNVNPPLGTDIHITKTGSSFLWAVFTIFLVATLAHLVVGHLRPASDRFFSYIITAITVVSAITYFSLASNLGFTGVAVEFVRYNDSRVAGFVRQVFWVRYIQYFINISLIVISLLLTARVPAAQILFTVFAAATTVVCMLVGALVRNRYKWGYFTFGLFIFLYVIYAIFLPGRRFSGALGSDVGRAFNIPAFWTLAILLLYPIAWGVSEGGNVISPNAEAVFYGILDLFLFLGFGALLEFGHRSIEPSRLGLRMRTYDEGLGGYQWTSASEKHASMPVGATATGHGHNIVSNDVSDVGNDGYSGVGVGHDTVDYAGVDTGVGHSGAAHAAVHDTEVPATTHTGVDPRV